MDIKVNQATGAAPVEGTTPVERDDGSFKFTLTSAIQDADLEQKLNMLINNYSVSIPSLINKDVKNTNT